MRAKLVSWLSQTEVTGSHFRVLLIPKHRVGLHRRTCSSLWCTLGGSSQESEDTFEACSCKCQANFWGVHYSDPDRSLSQLVSLPCVSKLLLFAWISILLLPFPLTPMSMAFVSCPLYQLYVFMVTTWMIPSFPVTLASVHLAGDIQRTTMSPQQWQWCHLVNFWRLQRYSADNLSQDYSSTTMWLWYFLFFHLRPSNLGRR